MAIMKTGAELAEYAAAQLGKPYWWGTYGQTANAGLYTAKSGQYPQIYGGYGDCTRDYGQKVHDCAGLIKGCLWSDGPESEPVYGRTEDVTAAGLFGHSPRRGPLSTMPDVPGVCVFQSGLGHVGVYVGNGQVVEAMGRAYGVVKTRLKDRNWYYWGMPEWFSYGAAEATAPARERGYTITLRELSRGCTGGDVAALQRDLLALGYDCGGFGDDGELGAGTEKSIRDYQRDHGLDADGVVGKDTMSALRGVEKE